MALTTGIEHLTPSPSKGQLFQGNYITNFDFTNQFLPDVYEKQAEIATKMGNVGVGPKIYETYFCNHQNTIKLF